MLKNGHLRRFPHPSALRRTAEYASFLRISGALHLTIFEQPEKDDFFTSLLGRQVIQSMETKKYDLISGLFWLLCSVLIIIGSFHLPLGTMGNPGPGFVPLLVGILLGIISLAIFFYALLQEPSGRKAFWTDKKKWPKVVATVLVILIYAIAFSHLGFFVSTFLLMFFLFKTIGGMKWKASLAGAILTSCCFYLVFKVWLKVQFPEGPLGM